MFTCYHCGKPIKGEVFHHIPANYLIALGIDFHKAFHPVCWHKAEEQAAKKLRGAA